MRPLRSGGRRGLSEIVGTLMLVVIVVGAAVAFSAFVASYQKQVQAEETLTHQRNLEDLRVLSMTPKTTNPKSSTLSFLTFTIASLDVESTVLTGMDINSVPVFNYTVTALYPSNGTSTPFSVGGGFGLTIAAQQQVVVQLDVNESPISPLPNESSMYTPGLVLSTNDLIKVDLYTALLNDFQLDFTPPTAVAFLSTLQSFTGTGYTTEPVLDGSQSIQPGNGSIVQWNWAVSDLTHPGVPQSYQGERVVPTLTTGDSYTATLTVTDNSGLIGIATTPTFVGP